MITKEQALEALKGLCNRPEERIGEPNAETLRQFIEQAAEQKLDAPAMVGQGRFGKGVSWATVIMAAQRRYQQEVTPENEAARLEKVAETNLIVSLRDAENADLRSKLAEAQARLAELEGRDAEPVYAFRRKGQPAFCTCDKNRYDELSDQPQFFETAIFYDHPATSTADQKDAERYRWLRDYGEGFDIAVREEDEDGETWVHGLPPRELDDAIDAAMIADSPTVPENRPASQDVMSPSEAKALAENVLEAIDKGKPVSDVSVERLAVFAMSTTQPDSPAHRAAKVLMDALRRISNTNAVDDD